MAQQAVRQPRACQISACFRTWRGEPPVAWSRSALLPTERGFNRKSFAPVFLPSIVAGLVAFEV